MFRILINLFKTQKCSFKNAIIYAAHTTFSVRNMPLTKQDCGIKLANPFELNTINICIQNDVTV